MADKYAYWTMTIDDYIEMCELAIKNGKKPGESMEDEFKELIKKKKAQLIGTGNKDIGLLTGDLRESGKKVLNLNEIERRKNNNK